MFKSLSTLIPGVIFVASVVFVIFGLLAKLRKKFPFKVNCWFCNVNAWVPYANKNSFTCLRCSQYNGFAEDGGYNQEIPAQHYAKLNLGKDSTFCNQLPRTLANNGLCEICNRNQELKIQQLSSFVPQNENNYDREISKYKDKLEDSYLLCPHCARHVKRTLTRVKNNVLGSKLAQTRGIKSIDLNMKYKSTKLVNNSTISKNFCAGLIILTSILNFMVDSKNFQVSNFLESQISHSLVIFYLYLVAFKETLIEFFIIIFEKIGVFDQFRIALDFKDFKYVLNQVQSEDYTALLPVIGIVLNITLLMSTRNLKHYIVGSVMLWSFKMCLEDISTIQPYLEYIKIVIALVILLTSIQMFFSLRKKIPVKAANANGSFHRLYQNLEEESDTEVDCSNDSIRSQSTIYSRKNISNRPTILRSMNSLNSLNSTKPLTKSFLTASSLQTLNSTNQNLMNSTFIEPLDDFNTTQQNQSFASQQVQQENSFRYNTTFENFNNSILKGTSSTLDLHNTKSFNVVPDNLENSQSYQQKVQHDINRLNLGGSSIASMRDFSTVASNPFSLDRISRSGSPALSQVSFCTSGYNKYNNSIVSPPRLNSMAGSDASWVAGGYWSTSPRKVSVEPMMVYPLVSSRTSSQSSGFGSQNFPSERNSRENSVCQDPDVFSVKSIFADNNPLQKKNETNMFDQSQVVYLNKSSSFMHPASVRGNQSFFNIGQKPNTSSLSSNQFGSYRDSFFK